MEPEACGGLREVDEYLHGGGKVDVLANWLRMSETAENGYRQAGARS